MGTFDPELATRNSSVFPDKKSGDTIGGFTRIVKEENGLQYTCVIWNDLNCVKCKEVKCPFFKGKES